jgi:hypothetical protein
MVPNPPERRPVPGALRQPSPHLGMLPGLKFMRTLWVCEVSGGPHKFAGPPRPIAIKLQPF